MPRGDGTGPMGQGPRSGRALGYCAGFDAPGFANGGRGRGGFGGGRGGRGFRHQYYATGLTGWERRNAPSFAPAAGDSRDAETRALRAQVDALEASLAEVRKRLADRDAAPSA